MNQLVVSAHVLWAFELLGSGAIHLHLGWTPHDPNSNQDAGKLSSNLSIATQAPRFVLGNKIEAYIILNNLPTYSQSKRNISLK